MRTNSVCFQNLLFSSDDEWQNKPGSNKVSEKEQNFRRNRSSKVAGDAPDNHLADCVSGHQGCAGQYVVTGIRNVSHTVLGQQDCGGADLRAGHVKKYRIIGNSECKVYEDKIGLGRRNQKTSRLNNLNNGRRRDPSRL